jgi:ATP diphosphatase
MFLSDRWRKELVKKIVASPLLAPQARRSPEASDPMPENPDLQKLVDLVARLRAPDGCPWDREQSLPDVRAYLLEEAHELAGAIDGGDWEELAEELGDMLFQVAFIARLAEEAGAFRLSQVIDRVHHKMVERHPHVFGDETLADAEAVRQAWERRKLQREPKRQSLFSGVPASLPALLAAYRLTQKASGVGFDWPDAAPVLAKAEEEIAELKGALAAGEKEGVREEVGDLLFTVANLARKLEVDPEAALAGTNLKFRRRFAHIEAALAAEGRTAAEATLAEMDALWDEAKREEAERATPES